MKVKLLKQLRKKACSLVQVSYDCERNEYKIISRYISNKTDKDISYYKKRKQALYWVKRERQIKTETLLMLWKKDNTDYVYKHYKISEVNKYSW